MLAKRMYGLRSCLNEQGVVFAYSGYVTEDILSGVGDALKRKLASEDAAVSTVRSVFAVFVEQMQNIIRYSIERLPARDGDAEKVSYGILTIGRAGRDYVVHAGNMIAETDVERMERRLSAIRGMDDAGLKAAYKERLRAEREAHSQGAGIGFIEIARRATAPIDFDFMALEDGRAFFVLEARIGKSEPRIAGSQAGTGT